MIRIRYRAERAKSSRAPVSLRLREENSEPLNLSDHTSKASHKLQKSKFGFFKLNHTQKRPKRQTDTNNSKSSSKELSSTLNLIHQSQVSILKEELELTWNNFKIPEQHRLLFLSSLNRFPALKAAVKIAREIDSIEKNNSNITSLLKTITLRESKLKELQKTLEKKPLELRIIGKSIEELRDISLTVIDFVEIWRKDALCEGEFLWEGGSYYEKMKNDSDFVEESELRSFFCLFKEDPLFFGPSCSKKIGKRVFVIPFSSKIAGRIKWAQGILGFSPVKPVKQSSVVSGEVSSACIEPLTSSASFFLQTEVPQIDPELQKMFKILSNSLSESLLSESISAITEQTTLECCKEILLASLTLHSSSILDKIISETLTKLLPSIARNSHTEVTDSEYLDMRNSILKEVFHEEILKISKKKTNFILTHQITDEIFNFFDLKQLVCETIDEEKQENMKIVFFVAEKLLEEFINSEWIDDIAEIEIVSAKMENAWIGLPGHIQGEIYIHQKRRIVGRVAEMVYFGILNDFVGGLWLGAVIKSVVKEGMEDVDEEFVLKDPNVVVEDTKRPSILKRNSVN